MKGHRDLVSSMSPHPSGKLALSVSRDKQMRLWDLTKGQCAYQAALGDDGDLVGFFQGGDMYYVSSSDPSTAKGSKVSLHSIQVTCCCHSTPTFLPMLSMLLELGSSTNDAFKFRQLCFARYVMSCCTARGYTVGCIVLMQCH